MALPLGAEATLAKGIKPDASTDDNSNSPPVQRRASQTPEETPNPSSTSSMPLSPPIGEHPMSSPLAIVEPHTGENISDRTVNTTTNTILPQPQDPEERVRELERQLAEAKKQVEEKKQTQQPSTQPEEKIEEKTNSSSAATPQQKEETLIFGRTPARIGHNIEKETERAIKGVTNLVTKGKWKVKKDKKEKKHKKG